MIVHPMVEAYLTKGLFTSIIKKWRKKYKLSISLKGDSALEFLEHHLFGEAG